ncbi:HNH endonuclease [Deinococcus terrestris]|uniref:HNH endonuclease n=1 Tax=Deinococcus terrestris TaxID=2651870 RepID=UPI0018836489|nr:HNH endonuclease [Deinococcus terrestris]
MTSEQWRGIPGFSRYAVSDCGGVMSLSRTTRANKTGVWLRPSKRLKLQVSPDGYDKVCLLGDDGKRAKVTVSRLMLLAFVGPPPSARHQAAHLDGNPRRNTLDNLAWKTPKENCADKVAHGTHLFGEAVWNAALTEATAERILLRLRDTRDSYSEILRDFPDVAVALAKMNAGENWAHVRPDIPRPIRPVRKFAPKRRLTAAEVAEIRRLYRHEAPRPGHRTLARRYGVSPTNMRRILSGATWTEES